MDRKQVGQERLGTPVMTAFEAVVDAVDRKPWPDFARDPVGYYFSRMIGSWLLRLMDSALSDEQLQVVSSDDVTAITLLLLRDMFRHNSRLLRPETADSEWIEELFSEVAGELNLPPARLRDEGRAYELDNIEQCSWARTLAAPFGLSPEKLFVCHSSIVTGASEEFGNESAER